jgi:hypothetical protein
MIFFAFYSLLPRLSFDTRLEVFFAFYRWVFPPPFFRLGSRFSFDHPYQSIRAFELKLSILILAYFQKLARIHTHHRSLSSLSFPPLVPILSSDHPSQSICAFELKLSTPMVAYFQKLAWIHTRHRSLSPLLFSPLVPVFRLITLINSFALSNLSYLSLWLLISKSSPESTLTIARFIPYPFPHRFLLFVWYSPPIQAHS